MKTQIRKEWKGFVPAHKPHSGLLCAYYHCPMLREEGRRFCGTHSKQYDKEALEQDPNTKVIKFA